MKEYTTANEINIQIAEKAKTIKYNKITPPFGYFGSKNNMAKKLCKNLPPHNCWIEGFCGSASLTLAKAPAPIEVINDIDNEIVNLFKQLRENCEELCKMIEYTPYSRCEFEQSRVAFDNDTELERARKFLIQSMMSINGVFGKEKGGFSYSQSYSRNGKDARVSRWYNLPNRLSKVVERLRSVRVDNRDTLELFKMFINRPATLIYLDPPYLGNRVQGYNNDINDKEYHEKLLKIANKAKCMVLLSGYENELYNDILTPKKGWVKNTIATYTKDSTGKSHNRCEVIWMNKYYQKALSKNKIPIRLTEKELKEKKLNPTR